MIDSKIHYLPVWDNNNFIGIISARRLLSAVVDSPELKIKLGEYIQKRRPLVSISQNDFLSKAIPYFKKYRISKLVVISSDYRLKGILAHYDVISYLLTPKHKQHQGAREGNKIPLLKQYVKNFMKTNVLTLTAANELNQAAHMILDKKIGSVVVVDPEHHPISIITTQDILSFFAGRLEMPKVTFSAKKLSKQSQRLVSTFVNQINQRFAKQKDIKSVKMTVKEKRGAGVFQAGLSIFSTGNKIIKVVKKEGKNLTQVLQEVFKKSK